MSEVTVMIWLGMYQIKSGKRKTGKRITLAEGQKYNSDDKHLDQSGIRGNLSC